MMMTLECISFNFYTPYSIKMLGNNQLPERKESNVANVTL